MKKLIKRFKTDYVSVKTGKKCRRFTFFRYHFPLISIPALILAIFLPPVGMLLAVLAMLCLVFTCPIRLIKAMASPLMCLRPSSICEDDYGSDRANLIVLAISITFFFLVAWVVALFNMFVCPWRLTLGKFDEKFIAREDYEALLAQQNAGFEEAENLTEETVLAY